VNRAIDRALWPSLFAATLLFVGWGLVPRATLFTTVLSPARLIAVAAVVKLVLLGLGALWSWRSRGSLDVGNPRPDARGCRRRAIRATASSRGRPARGAPA